MVERGRVAKLSEPKLRVGVLVAVVVVVAAVAAGVFLLRGDDEPSATPTTTESTTTTGPLSAQFTIDDLLTRDAQYSRFLELAEGTDLLDTLAGGEEVTALIPATPAFDGVELPESDEARRELLRGHLLEGTLDLAALVELDGTTVTSLNGRELPVAVVGNEVSVGGVTLAKTNIYAENGVIHVLDGVIRVHAGEIDAED